MLTILTGCCQAQKLHVPVGPVHLNFRTSLDPRGTRCAYILEFSINWPVARYLFVSSLRRTLDT